MATRWRPSYEFVQKVQQSPGVRAKLRAVAERKAAQAALVAREERVAVPISIEHGTRPRGRSYSRIMIPAVNEFGDSKTRRLRILGRVVGGR